jgi:hypothetical protein
MLRITLLCPMSQSETEILLDSVKSLMPSVSSISGHKYLARGILKAKRHEIGLKQTLK